MLDLYFARWQHKHIYTLHIKNIQGIHSTVTPDALPVAEQWKENGKEKYIRKENWLFTSI